MKRIEKSLRTIRENARWKPWGARVLAWTLVFALLTPALGRGFAQEELPPDGGLCVHHPEHTEECGYIEAREASPCRHVHDGSCGFVAPEEPAEPDGPAGPETPEVPGGPEEPEVPTEPETPAEPDPPAEPETPEGTAEPAGPDEAGEPEALAELTAYAGEAAPDDAEDPAEPEDPGTSAEPDGSVEPGEPAGPEEPASCDHEHDASCGYAEEQEGHPCGYLCGLCITGWTWDDGEDVLVWSDETSQWGLGLPGVSEENPVTPEFLEAFLPKTITAVTKAGTEAQVELIWDLGEFFSGAILGGYKLTAGLQGGYALTEAAPALEILLDLGGGEVYDDRFVNDWSFIPRDGTKIVLQEDGTFLMDMLVADTQDRNLLVQLLKDTLPAQLRGYGFYSAELLSAGFIRDDPNQTSGKLYGKVNLKWDIEEKLPETPPYADRYTFAAQPVRNGSGHKIVVNSNTGGQNSDDDPGLLSITVVFHDLDLASHTVRAATPQNVTVNLFDYWVQTQHPTVESGGDILSKSDWHIRPNADNVGNPVDGKNNTAYSTEQDWNRGINAGHLLLFGDGLIHAGLWNKGAGQSTQYGNRFAGMDGIVRNCLENGYPVINTADARGRLHNYELVRDYQLAGDHIGTQLGTEGSGAPYEGANIQNLSEAVIRTWGGNIETDTESLQYLFDPGMPNAYKTSYTGVTGLFQLDNDGYYYYNMRENFAEFSQEGGNHFILYDAPATTRTDGKQSVGNFFPFNKGSEVFNGLDDAGDLTSSIDCARNSMNHHLGMTVEVDFRQPAGGTINTGSGSKPMTFGFSGDDDVWVFIDDVLVLDLGGTHSEIYGTIDFSTGDVYIGRAFDSKGVPDNPEDPSIMVTHTTLLDAFRNAGQEGDAANWNGSTFASNTEHTLKMFYLERGNYDSSIALRFNLQPLLYQRIEKVDQNGDPLPGVEFALYAAGVTGDTSAIECLYTDGGTNSGTFYVRQEGNQPLVTLETDENGTALFRSGDGFFNFADRGDQYYILRETRAPAGYRQQPVDIVLHYDPATAMLTVANRWTTGAYACSVSNVTGTGSLNAGVLSGGTVTAGGAPISQREQESGLVVAVPLLQKKSTGGWLALYGSNLGGFASEEIAGNTEEAWKSAILAAVLNQARENGASNWYLTWDGANHRLMGTLNDLPGLASRYQLNNSSGDMQMVYGFIPASALQAAGINGASAGERYAKLGTLDADAARNILLNGFQLLSVSQFNRDFRSLIYIPNEQRELRVLKVDQDGNTCAGAQFGLYDDPGCTGDPVASGLTGADGMLVFSPGGNGGVGQARMVWANSSNTRYYLKEIAAPAGYLLNPTVIPVVVGTYSIYADAGTAEDGVSVMAGVGRLTQTMRQFADENSKVDITLQDITAFMQTQDSGSFSLTGWQDAKLAGSDAVRSMNLHFGKNAVVDYGLHDEDGGRLYKPFFVTDTGYIRARVQQNYEALMGGQYEGAEVDVNKEDLGSTDLTNLFSLLNIVVVTDRTVADTETGRLTISKRLAGDGLQAEDHTKNFIFTLELTDAQGTPLSGEFRYSFYGEDKWGYVSNGEKLVLHHDESVTILGLPEGTRYTVTEQEETGWYVSPGSEISGTIVKDEAAEALFTNAKSPIPDQPDPDKPDPDKPDPDKPDPDKPDPDKPDPDKPDPDKPDPDKPDPDQPDPDKPDPDKPDPDKPDPDKPDPDQPDPDQPDPDKPDPDKPDPDKPDPDKPDPDEPDPDQPDPDQPDPDEPDPDEPEPDDPDTPTDPATPPASPETPSDDPEEPAEEYLTELPDPNDPDSPEFVTIWEDGVPKTYKKVWDPEKEEWVYIPEDEVPQAGMEPPATGDGKYPGLWMLLGASSLAGLAALVFFRKGREEDSE